MRRVSIKFVALTLFVAALWCAADAQAEPFHDLSFDEALAKAGSEKKLVMIDFYTTRCPACKMLDKSTWTDADVVKWLGEHTIALKIDAMKEAALARRYGIRGVPSMVFTDAEGKEKSRIVGFRPPKDFLAAAANVLADAKRTTGAREQSEDSGKKDPIKRQARGDELARAGKHSQALAEYLWCFDHGLKYNRAYYNVRLSSLLSGIGQLGRDYAPALDALRKRRATAAQALLSGEGSFSHALDMSAINRELGQNERTLRIYDELHAAGKLNDDLRRAMFGGVLDPLLEAKRYQDIIDAVGEVGPVVDQRIARYQLAAAFSKKDQADALDRQRHATVQECAKYYEALLGTGQTDQAAKLAERLTEFDATGETFAGLITHAIHAGAPDAARRLGQRGLADLPETEYEKVKAAAKQIP